MKFLHKTTCILQHEIQQQRNIYTALTLKLRRKEDGVNIVVNFVRKDDNQFTIPTNVASVYIIIPYFKTKKKALNKLNKTDYKRHFTSGAN